MILRLLKVIMIGFVVRTLSQQSKKCKSYGSPGSLIANCSGLFKENDSEVSIPPSHLDRNLKVLDISHNIFDELNNKSFVNYPNLKRLIMINIQKKVPAWARNYTDLFYIFRFKVSVDLFKPLKELQELELTGTLFQTNNLEFQWPLKLYILELSSMSMSNFQGLSSLANLEEINFSNNSLRSLPSLNLEAPIRTINLKGNPLDKLNVSQIAPFCQLQELELRVKHDSAFFVNPSFCDCERLNIWMEKHEIFVEERLMCKSNKTDHLGKPDVNCSYNFDEENRAHALCTSRLGITPWELLLYAVFFSVLFPILYFGFDTYNRFYQSLAADKDPRMRGRLSNKVSKGGKSKSSLAGETPSTTDYEGDTYDYASDRYHDHEYHDDYDHDHDQEPLTTAKAKTSVKH